VTAPSQRGWRRLVARRLGLAALLGGVSAAVLIVFLVVSFSGERVRRWELLLLVALVGTGLVAGQRRLFGRRVRLAERRAASLPFPVGGFVDAVRKRWHQVRVTVLLAEEPKDQLMPLLTELASALPDEAAIDGRGRELLFVRLPATAADAADWCRALIDQVLAPLHRVAPLSEARFEEDLRGPLEPPRLFPKITAPAGR